MIVFFKNVGLVHKAGMNALDGSLQAHGLALSIPLVLALTALVRPRLAELASALALAASVGVSAAFAGGTGQGEGSALGVRLDVVTCVMLLLVSGIGLVIARYSRTYLHGDARLPFYFRWLLLTLSAVTSLVIASNLLVVAAAWTATSLALHQLLTFHGDRTAALVAAHKKFLVSRLADVSFWSCLGLVHLSVGSLELDRIREWAEVHPDLSPAMQVAATLAVVTVALKSALLPFHGWLVQVMEAPTPVSALLHAGVVNIGGFVMIRLSPWMAHAPAAQLLLVVVGLATTVVAALVMQTRVSVKVALAWSTCAQMGFMLLQCGLGAWDLALLHLIAHSLYKAHAFLSAGSTVDDWRLRALTTPTAQPSTVRFGVATLVALGAATGCVMLVEQLRAMPRATDLRVWVLAILVSLSLVPMVVRPAGWWSMVTRVGSATAVGLLYVAWHVAVAHLLPGADSVGRFTTVAWLLAGAGLVTLFALKATVSLRPHCRLARALYPWLFAGLFLDERFTRLTFRVWPPRLPQPASAEAVAVHAAVEV